MLRDRIKKKLLIASRRMYEINNICFVSFLFFVVVLFCLESIWPHCAPYDQQYFVCPLMFLPHDIFSAHESLESETGRIYVSPRRLLHFSCPSRFMSQPRILCSNTRMFRLFFFVFFLFFQWFVIITSFLSFFKMPISIVTNDIY